MQIHTVDPTTLRVLLNGSEVARYFGSFEQINYEDESTRHSLNRILKRAMNITDFSLNGKKLKIDVSAAPENGCCIVFTNQIKHPFHLRVMKPPFDLVIPYKTVDALLDAVAELYPSYDGKSCVYKDDTHYFLCLPRSAYRHLPGVRQVTPTQKNYLREHGTLISRDAVKDIGAVLHKAAVKKADESP